MNKKLLNIKFISLFCIFIIFDIKNMESSNLYLKINQIDQHLKNKTEVLITIENKKNNNNIKIIKKPDYSSMTAHNFFYNFFYQDEKSDQRHFFLEHYFLLNHIKNIYKFEDSNLKQILYYIQKFKIFCFPLKESMINSTNIIIPQPLKLDCANYCSSLINIPNHKKAFFTFFRTKKAFFDEEYIVTDYRHQLIDKNMKREDSPNTFHRIMVYKINNFLNHPDCRIELNDNDTIKPLLTISLPTHLQIYHKLPMKLIAFQDKTIIIQEKSNEKNYLCISLNPNLSIIDSIVAEKSIPIKIESEITKKNIVSPHSIISELKQTIKDDEKPSIIVDSIVAENPIPIATKPEKVKKL